MMQSEVFEARGKQDLSNQLHFWLKEKQPTRIVCAAQSEQTQTGPLGFRITLTVFYEPAS